MSRRVTPFGGPCHDDDATAAVNAALSKVFALANDHAFTPEGWSTPVVSINRLAEIVAAVSGGAS